jgi:hypothetical protein
MPEPVAAPDHAAFAEEVRERVAEDYHGLHHNGNDHSQGPLSNCPKCAAEGLLAWGGALLVERQQAEERNERLRGIVAESQLRTRAAVRVLNAHRLDAEYLAAYEELKSDPSAAVLAVEEGTQP